MSTLQPTERERQDSMTESRYSPSPLSPLVPMNSVVDPAGADTRSAARNRVCGIGLVMLVLSVLVGTVVTQYSYSALTSDIVKIVAVVIFVGAMIALAMGMIGEMSNDR